jgi:hypothetical protein
MVRQGTCVIVGLLALVATGCGGESNSSGSSTMTVDLNEQSASGESGSATLTAEGDKTTVVIDLQGNSSAQPAHIHKGSCADLDAMPEYALADVKGGTSTSTVDAKLADLRDGAFAINVHKSAAEVETYVACGNVGEGDGSGTGGMY